MIGKHACLFFKMVSLCRMRRLRHNEILIASIFYNFRDFYSKKNNAESLSFSTSPLIGLITDSYFGIKVFPLSRILS